MQAPAQGRGRGGVGNGGWGPPNAGWGGPAGVPAGVPGGWSGGWWYCTGWGPLPQQLQPPLPQTPPAHNNNGGGGIGVWGGGGGGVYTTLPPPSPNQVSPPAGQQTPTPLNNEINTGGGGGTRGLPSEDDNINININSGGGGGVVYGPPPPTTPPPPLQRNNSGMGPNTLDIGSYAWAEKDNEIRVDPSAFNDHTGTIMIGNRTHAGRNNIVRVGAGVANQPQAPHPNGGGGADNPAGNRSSQGTSGYFGRMWQQNFYFTSSSCGYRSQNQILRYGLLFCGIKLNTCGPKKRSLSRPLAMALALEQEPIGSEHVKQVTDSEDPESKGADWKAVDRAESDEGVHSEGRELEMPSESEAVEKGSGAELIEKDRVDVRALGLSLQGAKTADDVEELLKNAKDLPLPVYSSIIRAFGFDKTLEPAFALVEWLKRKKQRSDGAVGPNLFTYNSLLGAIKQAGQFEKINGVMEDMKSEGIVPNIVTYNTLMSVHLEQGRPGEALSVLDDIEKVGLSPSPVTYSTVLLAYREMENASGAIEFFAKLRGEYETVKLGEDNDYDWDVELGKLENFTIRVCYLIMRQILVKEDNPATNVFKVLTGMDNAMLKLGQAEYERLIWACTREGHYTVARELYRRIREMHSDISLSVCNHVIWLMGKARKWWAALEIYEDLLDKGPKPNNMSYELIISHFNILLSAASRKGIWRWGVRLINKMIEKGLRPGTREWNAVLVACSKASETAAAVEIFRRMVDQGEKPTILSYGALLSALEKGKLYDEALRVWEHMCKVGIKPNLHAYTILASIYIGKGRHEMVDSILFDMQEAKIQPTVVTFNAIITGCAKNQMGAAAFEWFHRMTVQNIKPNHITYDMLIEALARDGKLRLAYEMYLRARNEQLHPSSRAYDAVVECCRYYDTDLDINALGPRPLEKKSVLKIRKNLSDFCSLADVPIRGKPFDRSETYSSPM